MDLGYTPQQFVALFNTPTARQVEMLTAEFVAEMPRGAWRQFCRSCL